MEGVVYTSWRGIEGDSNLMYEGGSEREKKGLKNAKKITK